MKRLIVTVHTIQCVTCGYTACALDPERTKAAMLEHLVYAHSGEAA